MLLDSQQVSPACLFLDALLLCIIMVSATEMGCVAMALVSGIPVHEVPLRRSPGSPWCYAATAFTLEDEEDGDSENLERGGSAVRVSMSRNFLASQVWPAARVAASVMERYFDPAWTICELGCGPGLPSIAAAKAGAARVVATDLDPFALKLVKAAADKQGLHNLWTLEFDLTSHDEPLPDADLYVMSDVFESAAVARGASEHTVRALENGRKVWVFAQSDRAQRENFRRNLVELLPRRDMDFKWSTRVTAESKLLLYDVDETKVDYV